METLALCPFAVGTLVWQPEPGTFTLTAIAKATFRLVHGREAQLLDQQDALGVDRFHDGDASGSLYAPSDMVPYKPRTDVLVVGHAYAPSGRPVDALVARFTVGDLTKAVGIVGDRLWVEGADCLEPSPPKPFTRMPLRYERAARGPLNPVGLDIMAPQAAGAMALPNLEATEDDPAQEGTVGFGPVPPLWPTRRSLLDAAGAAFVDRGERGSPPPGFDFGYYNSAPLDQQLPILRSGERIVLQNLHPEHAHVETRLPAVKPKAFAIINDRATEIALRCDTVLIDTDRGVAVMTWRGLTDVDSEQAGAISTLVFVAESKGHEVRARHVERMLRERAGTVGLEGSDFDDSLGKRHDSVRPDAPPPPSIPPREAAIADDDSTGMDAVTQRLTAGRLREIEHGGEMTGTEATILEPMTPASGAISEPPTAPVVLADLVPPSGHDRPARTGASEPAPARPSDAPTDDDRSAPDGLPGGGDDGPGPVAATPSKPADAAESGSEDAAAAPAPGGPEDGEAREASAPASERTNDDDEEPVETQERRQPMPPASTREVDEVDVERTEPPASSAKPGAAPGELSLMEYARLVVAAERGDIDRALAAYALDRDALARLQDTWRARASADPKIATEVAEAIEAARWE